MNAERIEQEYQDSYKELKRSEEELERDVLNDAKVQMSVWMLLVR